MNAERQGILVNRLDSIEKEYKWGNKDKAFHYLTEILKEVIREESQDNQRISDLINITKEHNDNINNHSQALTELQSKEHVHNGKSKNK